MKWSLVVYAIAISSLLLISCEYINQFNTKDTKQSKVVSINNEVLYLDELNSSIPSVENAADSISYTNSYIEKWIISQLLFKKASSHQAKKTDIERKVSNYRKELYIHDFEQDILKNSKLTAVDSTEISEFYTTYKNEDLLTEKIYKVKIIILEDEVEKLRRFETGWRKGKEIIINEYKALAHFHQLDTTNWYSQSELINILPAGFPKEKLSGTGFKKSKVGEHYCFIQILRIKNKRTPPPLSFVKQKIIKILTYQKQRDFLKRYKEDLYKEALRLKKIQLY